MLSAVSSNLNSKLKDLVSVSTSATPAREKMQSQLDEIEAEVDSVHKLFKASDLYYKSHTFTGYLGKKLNDIQTSIDKHIYDKYFAQYEGVRFD